MGCGVVVWFGQWPRRERCSVALDGLENLIAERHRAFFGCLDEVVGKVERLSKLVGCWVVGWRLVVRVDGEVVDAYRTPHSPARSLGCFGELVGKDRDEVGELITEREPVVVERPRDRLVVVSAEPACFGAVVADCCGEDSARVA